MKINGVDIFDQWGITRLRSFFSKWPPDDIIKNYIELFIKKSQLIPLFRLICSPGINLSGYVDDISNHRHINTKWPPNDIFKKIYIELFVKKSQLIPLFRLI